MAWKDKTKRSKIFFITFITLVAVDLLLAIILPLIFKRRESWAFSLLTFQYSILIPIIKVFGILFSIDWLSSPKKKSSEKENYDVLGRLIGLGISTIFLLLYSAYKIFLRNDTQSFDLLILMFILFTLSIVFGPFIGRICKKLNLKKKLKL